MRTFKINRKEVESRLRNAYAYIENRVLAWNNTELSDITWKFTLGDIILNVAKIMKIDIEKGSSIDLQTEDDGSETLFIGDAIINIKTNKSLGELNDS